MLALPNALALIWLCILALANALPLEVRAAPVAPQPPGIPPEKPGRARSDEGMPGLLEVLGVVTLVGLAAAHVPAGLADAEVLGAAALLARLPRGTQAAGRQVGGPVRALRARLLHPAVRLPAPRRRSTKWSRHAGSSRSCAASRSCLLYTSDAADERS